MIIQDGMDQKEHEDNFWFELGFAKTKAEKEGDIPKLEDMKRQLESLNKKETNDTYQPLKEIVNLMAGMPERTSMNAGEQGLLWRKAISTKKNGWDVRTRITEGYNDTLVHVGDFAQWAFQKGFHIHSNCFVEKVKKGTIPLSGYQWILVTRIPDLIKERKHKFSLRDRINSHGEDKDIKAVIHEIEDDLSRFLSEVKNWWEFYEYQEEQELLQDNRGSTGLEIGNSEGHSTESIPRQDSNAEQPTVVGDKAKPARKAKKRNATERNKDIVDFYKFLYEKGVKKGRNWAKQGEPLPYTRKDFMQVFYYHHSEYKTIKKSYAEKLLNKLKLKFKQGTKNGKVIGIHELIKD